jgi:hypothetical protein
MMTSRGLVLLVLVLAAAEAAKPGNVDFIGEWNFHDLPSISNQIQNFISGKSTTQFLQPVSDKSKSLLPIQNGGKQFSVIKPKIPRPAPSFSIHGNSQYLEYPKARKLQIVPRMKARERIFIRSKLKSAKGSNAPMSQPMIPAPFNGPQQQAITHQPIPQTQMRSQRRPPFTTGPHAFAKQTPPPTQPAQVQARQNPTPRYVPFPGTGNQGKINLKQTNQGLLGIFLSQLVSQ